MISQPRIRLCTDVVHYHIDNLRISTLGRCQYRHLDVVTKKRFLLIANFLPILCLVYSLNGRHNVRWDQTFIHSTTWWRSFSFRMNINQYTKVCVTALSSPSVIWRCWLGDRKGIRPVRTLHQNPLCRDYNCDSTIQYDYDVSRAPDSIRREQKMNMSFFSS